MKILVVFYSRSGISRKVGQTIARELKADLQEIVPFKGYKGLFGFIRAGFQAIRGKTPAIKPLDKDLAAYDLVIFGTPIWGSRMSSPLRTAVTENKPKIRKYAFYCTAGDENQEKAFADAKELVGFTPVATMTVLSQEAIEDKTGEKINAFIAALSR
jgi:flavodoxin